MTCAAALQLPADSTAILTVTLVNEDAEPINGATLNITLYHDDGVTEVAGETWPQPMNYVSASAGVYTLMFSDELEVELNETLKLVGVAEDSEGHRRTIRRDIDVVE